MDIPVRWNINASLYGPNRLISNNTIKSVLLKDHVLQEGEWDAEAKRIEPWTTTTANNFKKPLPSLNEFRRKVKSEGREGSSLIFGSCSNFKLPTTLKDFDRKWLDAPKKTQPNMGTSIPDFATKYLLNNKIGHDGSIYTDSYSKAKKVDTSEGTKERRKHTMDLRTTHFHLGDTRNNYDTENKYRYLPSKMLSDCPASISSNAAIETYKSNVFRNGDWNILELNPTLPFSVTRHDFHVKPFISDDTSSRTDRPRRVSFPNNGSSQVGSLVMTLRQKIIQNSMAKLGGMKGDSFTVKMHQAFMQFDPESSGCITKDQLKRVISEYVQSVSEVEIDALLTESNSLKHDGDVMYNVLTKYINRFLNEAEEKLEKSFQSIQQEDDPSHPYYHISTHFQFGDDHDQQRSVYHDDYLTRDQWFQPFRVSAPLSSKVLPEASEFNVQKSTKQSDYVFHGEGKVVTETREKEMKRNQSRLAKQSIELAADPKTAQAYRQTSVSSKDFPSPPTEFRPLTPRRAPLSQYHYLETNDALPVPPTDTYLTEIQDKYKNQRSPTTFKEKNKECLQRTGDNRSSHFILGADSEPKGSEQINEAVWKYLEIRISLEHHQFPKKTLFGSSVPAAGKKQTAEQNYSHVYPRFSIPWDPNNTKVHKTFLEFDKTLSGKISIEDFQSACNNLHIPCEDIQNTLERCKADKECKIDYIKFIEGFSERFSKANKPWPNMTSVMKSDYSPPEEKSFSSAQKRNITMATKPFISMDSHYFHYDHSKERSKLTTTGHDFSRPDRLGSERKSLSIF